MVDKSIFAQRRQRFMAQMGSGVAIIATSPVVFRSKDSDYPYRPNSDFWYLTGFGEPDAIAIIAPGRNGQEFVLFVNPKDPAKEVWTGRRSGVEGAVKEFGADAAYPLAELDEVVPRFLENAPRLFYELGQNRDLDARVLGWLKQVQGKIRQGVTAPDCVVNPATMLSEFRLIKEPQEQAIMQRSAEVAADAHAKAMAAVRPGMYEYELQALVEYAFRSQGADGPSYNSIVGSGPNACILHYTANNRQIQAGELVLVDAGCELLGYASDITRTFPAGGVFTPQQRALYQLVLSTQKACIEMVAPGVSFLAIHNEAVRHLTAGLVQLGILSGAVDQLVETEAFKPYYMHKTSHWLGMDVHDVGRYQIEGQWRTLTAGMVLTVEPGLYIPAGSACDPQWFDIGIRIEDDVLVTESGHAVLSAGAPKEIVDIERVPTMARATGC